MTDPILDPPKRKKPKSMSPTQRSLKHMRERGYHVAITEHWNPHVGIRQDMFGYVDLLAVPHPECKESPYRLVAIQATAAGVSARLAKILALDAEKGVVRSWLLTGARIEIHGWTTKRSKAKNVDGTRSHRPEVRMRLLRLAWDPEAGCITSAED